MTVISPWAEEDQSGPLKLVRYAFELARILARIFHGFTDFLNRFSKGMQNPGLRKPRATVREPRDGPEAPRAFEAFCEAGASRSLLSSSRDVRM